MSPGRGPRSLVFGVVVATMLAVAACGDTGDITAVGEPQGVTTTAGEETTSESSDETTGTIETETTDAGTTATTAGGDTGTTAAPGGDATETTVASDVSWTSSPGEFRGQDGLRVAYDCTPGGTPAAVWGTGPFTDDSSVCTAGVYAGVITVAGGGRVVVRITPGLDEYSAGAANGITASGYGTWAGSFEVVAG